MTTYRVPVADTLLELHEVWDQVEGLRLVTVDGPWLAHPNVTICTFEDDYAPADLEGQLVEPWFQRGNDGVYRVVSREVVRT